MIKLILVRHGETLWNKTGKYQGHSDIPLSKKGLEQAAKVAKRLKFEKISAIYASDLQRAKQTAGIIALEHDLQVIAQPALREINFGIWEGKTFSELEKNYPELLKTWLNDPEKLVIPEGETFQQLTIRVWNSVRDILINHKNNDTILVVAHGGTISALICRILEINLKNLWKIKQGNTGVSIIEFYDEKGIITLLNDTNHLEIVS